MLRKVPIFLRTLEGLLSRRRWKTSRERSMNADFACTIRGIDPSLGNNLDRSRPVVHDEMMNRVCRGGFIYRGRLVIRMPMVGVATYYVR
jgi:hypothetical protein